MFWQQGRTHCLQLANPKKKVLENWRNLWIFSKSFLWGLRRQCLFFVANWQIFKKKRKEKFGDDFYKFLIIFLYSWLHIKKKIKNLPKFYYFFLTCNN